MSFNNPATTIDGSDVEGTITGNTVQTAETGLRIALNDPAYPGAIALFSGNANEVDPGLIEPVLGGANFGVLSVKSPNLGGGVSYVDLESYDDGHTTLNAAADNISIEASSTLDLINFGGPVKIGSDVLPGSYLEVDGDQLLGADLSDSSNTIPGRVYSVAYAGVTDASGFLTVAHGQAFTPAAGWAMTTNPGSSFAMPWGIDSLGAVNVRLRFTSVNAFGPLAATAVAGRIFLLAP